MEQKKSVVLQAKFIEKFDYNGKTYYSHGVAFKNKDVGIYNCLKEDQTDFLEGHEAEYTIEKNLEQPKKSKIKLVKAKTTETIAQTEKSVEKAKNSVKININDDYWIVQSVEAIKFTASYAKDIYLQKTDKKYSEIANEILNWQLDQLIKIKDSIK